MTRQEEFNDSTVEDEEAKEAASKEQDESLKDLINRTHKWKRRKS